jgi:hypothetical protein
MFAQRFRYWLIVRMLRVVRRLCWDATHDFSYHLFVDACGDAKMYRPEHKSADWNPSDIARGNGPCSQ